MVPMAVSTADGRSVYTLSLRTALTLVVIGILDNACVGRSHALHSVAVAVITGIFNSFLVMINY